jgi:hypothetical protein
MIGIVEIYKNYGTPDQELLVEERNLVVDGAGETLCDLWTTPSGAVSAVPGLTDSSNYAIQAISFGKGSNAYKENAHFFPLHSSSYALSADENELKYYSYVNLVKTDNILRAVSEHEKNIGYTVSSYDPKCDVGTTPNVTDKVLERNTETAIDVVAGETHLMNNQYMQGRAHAYGHNLNRVVSNTNPNLLSYTTDLTDSLVWPRSGAVDGITLLDETTGPFWGTSATQVSGGSAGNPWIRQQYNTTEYSKQKRYFCVNTDHTLSIYAKIPNTVSLQPSGLKINVKGETPAGAPGGTGHIGWFSVLGRGTGPAYFAVNRGEDCSAGVETLGVGDEGNTVGWQRLHVRIPGVGTSVAGSGMRGTYTIVPDTGIDCTLDLYGPQLEESYGPTQYQSVSAVSPSFDEGGLDGDLFLGCYPDLSGTRYGIVSSLPNLNYFEPSAGIFASGTYPFTTTEHFFNLSSLRSMDQNGFVKAYYPLLGEANDPASGMVVSANHDFSSTGELSCVCTISSGDLGLANMYGGIFKCGLWTVDIENTLKGKTPTIDIKYPQTPPFTFKAGSNRLVYRLFAEKSFTYNLARIKDDGTDAGCLNYDPLTLVWRIKFL